MSAELNGVFAHDLTDTSGALHLLEQRSGKTFSPDTLHYLVRKQKLPAYVFSNAELVRWQPGQERRGQTMIFLKKDIYGVPTHLKKRGRGAEKTEHQSSDVTERSA